MQNTTKKAEDPNIGKFLNPYTITRKLGSGSFGEVYQCKSKVNPEKKYAVKIIPQKSIKSKQMRELLNTEVAIMQQFDHPGIMKLYDILESTNNIYLVMNFCSNGDMQAYMKKRGQAFFKEFEALQYLKQIGVIFKELHKKQVMHRDFKLENLFMNEENVLIGDFGLSKKGVQITTTWIGTPMYMAPEILQGKAYTNSADLWSVGVTFYEMLYGIFPFKGNNEKELQASIQQNSGKNLKFPTYINKISRECMQLLGQMIEPDTNKRLLWSQFFQHKIFAPSQNAYYEIQRNKDPAIRMFQSIMHIDQSFADAKQEYLGGARDFGTDGCNLNANNMKYIRDGKEVVPRIIKVTEEKIDDLTQSKIQEKGNMKEIFESYTKYYAHEKQRVDFIASAAQRLRGQFKNLTKKVHVSSSQIPDLLIAYISLYKMFSVARFRQYFELSHKKNIMNFKLFDQYSKSSIYKEYLKVYEQQIPEIRNYFLSLLQYPKDVFLGKEESDLLKDLQITTYDVNLLPKILDQKLAKIQPLLKFSSINSDKDLETELTLGLYYAYHAIRSEKFFEYKHGKHLNFNDLYKQINSSNPAKLAQFLAAKIK